MASPPGDQPVVSAGLRAAASAGSLQTQPFGGEAAHVAGTASSAAAQRAQVSGQTGRDWRAARAPVADVHATRFGHHPRQCLGQRRLVTGRYQQPRIRRYRVGNRTRRGADDRQSRASASASAMP